MSSIEANSEPIAIVGSGCRFPGGANSPSKLWNLLVEKRDALREIDSSRFNPQGFYHSNGERHGCINITKAYTLEEDVRAFDASFFGINPKEAEAIDPQHRILLETVYEAMEAGGFSIEGMRASNTAVYVGVMTGDYLELLLRSPHTMPKYVATGTAASILSNRISYFFDWKGPSVTLNTACSSSLVAVHHAVQSLRSGESRMALAGGSNLILGPEFMIGECNLHMLSPDGRSRMWDAGANGYARGEGFAAVIMKKLSDAIADRDDIQCIIRETGVNSDGRTQGITLPSPQAQTKLIREVYQRAGLNPLASIDRCQYFEAHGTGTPAGDPLEATGIRDAFFPQSEKVDPQHNGTMLVGSVKTAVGHTEGTAGLAGLIKVAQALKRGVIPPNMLFEKLNPKLSPLTSNLRIATEQQPWPSLPPGVPRRASVNSFGFGGTNAHAVVESYEPPASPRFSRGMESLPLAIPLTFSANSERSLTTMIASYKSYIEQNLSVCLNDMAWTLQSRRSEFPVKAHFSGPSREELLSQMEAAIVKANESPPGAVGQRSPGRPSKARIFGVFTGQGAQWPNMGRDLILASSMARDTIVYLEDCLKELPDGPSWSLMQELTDKERPSRLDEAELAQPISTAVQVMIINILQSAGVSFAAVVGHSSGEISAAYAAEVITASEAIKIAYYRGYHSKLSKGANGQPGAMLAAGLSFDDATEFCSKPTISNRVVVAASNAPQSVTLSGDIDAIHTAKALLDRNGIFNRMLKVNKAYHSHHMEPCSQAYISSLKACGINPKYPRDGCWWVSSVVGDRIEEAASLESLASTYWNDNMLKPVLFSMAVEQALQIDSKYDMALEVGPHPALKGPALQTIKAATDSSLSYGATLTRGTNDVAALSGTFGFLMEHMPNSSLKVDRYIESFQPNVSPRLLTDLPTYAWDHSQTFWSESRYSKNYRLRNKARHDLLGERYPDDLEYDMRWRNTIRVSETPWLAGHKIQGQIVYPAAAYLVMALEASKDLAGSDRVSLIELLDVEISRAIPLEDDASGVDTLFTLRKTHEGIRHEAKFIEATFGCFSCVGEQAEGWDVNARGSIRLTFGEDANQTPPKRDSPPVLLNPLNVTTFYDFLKEIGFEYTGLFRRLDTIDRRMNRATSVAVEYPEDKEMSAMVHPALLDAAFQSVFAALQYPGDGSMSAPYVPTNIKSIRMTAGSKPSEERQIAIESFITSNNGSDIVGDIEMYDAKTGNATIHVEGLSCTSLDRPRPANDVELYAQNVWKADISNQGLEPGLDHQTLLPELSLVQLCERLSYMYLRHIHAAMSGQDISSCGPHHRCVSEWADRLLPVVQSGQHPTIAERWASEDSEQLMEEVARHPNVVDLNAIQMIGQSLLASLNEKVDTVDHGLSGSFVQSYFDYGLGMNHANTVLGKTVSQIAHRYPGMRILEVNAGNTATSRSVLAEVRDAFKSYTVAQKGADPSAGTHESLKSWGTRLKFQSLDLEGDIVAQGYEGIAYDLVIAANSLYAASNQSDAIRNVRKLLKPGGHLLLLETTGELESTRLVRSGLPGYWSSDKTARRYEPPNSVSQWTFILEGNGFSGVDRIVNDTGNDLRQTVSVMLSQAINDDIDFLRSPSTPPALALSVGSICFIGRNQRRNADVTSYLLRSFRRLNSGLPKVTYLDRIENVLGCSEPITSVIFLQDLDEPIWRSLSDEMLRSFKKLLSEARHLLWVTSGCRLENPYANMSVGMGRGLQAEYSHIRFQLLDVDPKSLQFSNHLLAEAVMRLIAYDSIKASTPDMLWTLEPEMIIEEGKVMIPRVIADSNMNNRLNAKRRNIKKTIQSQDSRIVVEESNGLYRLSEPDVALCTTQPSSEAIIRVERILLSTIRVSEFAHPYLCIGEIAESRVSASIGTRVLAFTDTISTTVSIPMSHIFTLSDNAKSDALFLQAVAAVLLADIALSQLRHGSTALVFESDNALSKVFERRARDRGHEILRASSKVATTETGVIHIDAHAPVRKIKARLPPNIDLLLNFGDEGALDRCLNKTAIIINVNDLFGKGSQAPLGTIPNGLLALLEEAQTLAPQFIEDVLGTPVTTLSEISADPTTRPHLSVIDLSRETDMTITVAPIEFQTLFRPNRTYLLVGCTGGLGQSLCRWMVANGARHLALTSRNPKSVNQIWLDELRSMGGNPQIFETDVVDAAALEKTYGEINSRMPPIAGVANAAMVLSDSLFDDINYGDFSKVLKPKVEGTANLDRLFSRQDLDFFILFSSFASTVGNRGQTNYLAANMYMATIAAQRRSKGLAASVMHIGMVLGLGVVFQTGLYETTMKRLNYMPISEPAFLDMFAQCIVVGRPDSGYSNEFITGLGRLSTRADAPKPFYASNVRFSHHVLHDDEGSSADVSGTSVSLAQQLAAAKGLDEQSAIIQDVFVGKLERVLQSSRDQIHASQGLIALGVDSLMAVEVRSWFLSELEVDMPVLKLLGGASISEICTEAAKLRPHTDAAAENNPAAPVVQDVTLPPKAGSQLLSIGKQSPKQFPEQPSHGSSGSPVASATLTPALSNQTPLTTPSVSSDGEQGFKWEPITEKPKTFPTKIAGSTLGLERTGRMAFPQERLWFLRFYLSDPTTYNITLAYKLTGPLRIEAMMKAFDATIERHEILRTAFYTDPSTGEAQQGVMAKSPFKMEQLDITDDSQVEEEFRNTNRHVYNLEQGDSMRAKLLRKDADNHYLIMGYHHIALDATTSLLLVRDFAMIYSGMSLQPLKLQYLDYAAKQRGLVQETGSKDIAFWKSEFPDSPPVLHFFDFGSVKLRKPLMDYKIRILEARVDAATTSKLKTASQKMQVTGFHLHLATLQVLLHRLLRIDDVCIGITDANKSDPDHFDTLGFFVNLLPIRSRIDGKQSFAGIAQKAKEKTFQALAHSQLPFDVLLDELNIPRTTDHTPLFQVLMNYKMGSNRTVPLGECKAEAVQFEDASNPYDLQFDVEVAVDGTTLITATTQSHIYSDADLSTVMRTYCHLLQSMAAKPSLPVSNHKLFTSQDINDALEMGKGPRVKVDQSLTISRLFDRSVEQRSTDVAVVDNVGGCLTWNQTAARVHALATHLLRIGVKAQSFVAVYCEPTVNSVCYWLAILRIGAIYVPLDVSNPAERLRLIVVDCKPSAIICDKHTIELARGFQVPNCHLFRLSDLNSLRPQFVRDASHPGSIACVIYTSGTTGTPKGTLLTNSNLVNHVLGVNEKYGMSQEIVLQSTNLGFDLSLAQMMQFLCSQGKLVVASHHSRNDPVELAKLMVQHEVTYTIVTPSVYTILLQQGHESLKQCTKWRTAFSCGEALTGPVVKDFQLLNLPGLRLINSCGPTEITIINSAWEIPLKDPNASDYVMMIGNSLPNYTAYILDESGRPLPLGFAGEMVCGGAGISHGYLGKEELTATKWVRDPFASEADKAHGWNRMYRTGDKAKLLPNGQLVFLGRIDGDQQIKLRGVRIELDDITNTVIRHVHGEISEAAVALRGEGDAAFLVAFVVFAPNASQEKSGDWRENLIAGLPLPASMKPSRLVVLPHLPRTANGKIDRRALKTMPLPSLGEISAGNESLTTTESALRTIWTNAIPSTMPNSIVRRNTDFFHAGGNSMLLVGVQARIRQSFGLDIPLFKLFQASTLANMAALIEATNAPEVKTKIDWGLKTSLDKVLYTLPAKSSDPKPVVNVGVEILLTGSTGFLGARILQELVADERVVAIHCLAIRKPNGSTSRTLASDSPKIIKYYGDLASERLGLSEEEFADLAQNVDRIIHNGADVSFLKAYTTLEQTNLGSTKQLARLAMERKIPFHFVSTAGVAQFYPMDELPEEFIPANNAPPTDMIGGGVGGYAASKWASEKYLQQCAEKLGLPVCVHRPSNILGAGAENVNLTANVIEYSLRIGAAPETPNLKGFMQFVSVDEVGQGLVDSLFSTNAAAAGARVIHHCSDEKVAIAELKGYLEKKYDRKLLSLELTEWVEQAKSKGLTEQTAMMMLEVLRNADGAMQMKVLSQGSKRLSTALTSWFQESQR